MKKGLLALSILLLLGCNQEVKNQPSTFRNEEIIPFSLELPAPHLKQQHAILAIQPEAFPNIFYTFTEEGDEATLEDYLEKEREFQAQNCEEAEGVKCGTVIEDEKMTIHGEEVLKYVVRYPSLDPETEGDYANNYHYSIKQGKFMVHLWTYGYELKEPEKTEQKMDEIMQSFQLTKSKDPLEELTI